ncbi:probable ATP-dependent RNA helicase DHX34 isoform X2 [Physella acuta]|uniref:probable ATP-dependent RNA helicase DHX34 isoform X2 n=1 Tax=Physella acuta TaxID=109671 RepID=UPI0027DE074D|nr:probable ATP-dependent RNA helicase DHX34 isoform X2 [Physella acuta]
MSEFEYGSDSCSDSASESESDDRSKYTSKKGEKSADKECKAKHRHSKHLSELVKSKHSQSHGTLSNKKKYSDACHLSKDLHIDRNCKSKHKHKSDEDRTSSDSDDSETKKSESLKGGKRDKRKKSSRREAATSTTPTKKPQDCLDFNFDFHKYKYSLGKIFFKDVYFSKISDKRSQEQDDFWAFVSRYQQFQRKKAEKGGVTAEHSSRHKGHLELPQKYDVNYRINLSFLSKDFDIFLKKNRLVDHHLEKELTRERIIQFRSIIIHYLDFQQKLKFQKLIKIRKDQRSLPIFHYKEKILELVKQHQVIVVAGDTGCGKSTQVPQYLMEAGYDKIACTQPRRIACISLSKRVGYETLNEYGTQVAFQVRFDKSKTAATKILFLTEGLLLRQMSSDPLLEMYSVIVIDEVHERHIYTDFLLGVLKCVLKQRSDLKLVLMSATININLFSHYFHDAPVIKVPGRLYPIELEYCPIRKDDKKESKRLDPTPYLRIMQRIDHKYPSSERGDLLIFLSGMSEIMAVVEAAKAYAQQMKRWIVLPLHSALSIEEQDKVFDFPPDGVRKCIVSTNIAETSVTIDGVRFIVDSGKVKEMSFDPKYKMQKLQEFWISRASSEQRKGRAGRTGPGVCFRLYEESDYNMFEEYSTPELQRVPLDSLILQMISMGLPDARKFPFIEPPSMSSLENSIQFLKEQGALSSDESLTPIGQMLAMLPVDVVIGKMLIMGSIFNMIDPVLSVTAAMSVQSPFTNQAYTNPEALTARRPLESEHGDPFTLLNAFDEWIQVKAEGLGTRKWCRRRGLEEQRFYEMIKLKRQFRDLLKDHHLLDGGEERQQYMSSDERRIKHGERKRLGELRREKMRETKRRKILTLEDEDYTISDEEGDTTGDIKDLEFRLSNDLSQLQETSNKSRSFTLRDINLMKIILSSGLYPQMAIADDCNTYKRDTEQVFHTKNKPFILLHPTCVFASHPDLLTPKLADGKRPAPSELKGLLSSKHEFLSYVSLLETNNKPYLVNTMRVPALQTVTLFSNCIDTNADCTRLICDGWLEVKFSSPEVAEVVVSSVVQLRNTWHNLLKVRLKDTFEGIEEERRVSPRARQLERVLASKLTEFLHSDFVYAVRRVLPAEMQHVYVGPGHGSGGTDVLNKLVKGGSDGKEHPVKGGVQVTDYLTFSCLLDETSASIWGEFTTSMQRHWTCENCKQSMLVTVLERLQHEAVCCPQVTQGSHVPAVEEKETEKAPNPSQRSYFCPECNLHILLTATEILKHRKIHPAKVSSLR